MKTANKKEVYKVVTRIALGGGVQSTHRTLAAAIKAAAKLRRSVSGNSYIDARIVDSNGDTVCAD